MRASREGLAARISQFFCGCARPSSSFHGSVQDPHPSGKITGMGAGTGGRSSCDGRGTPELLPSIQHPLPLGGWVGGCAPVLAGSPGVPDPPPWHRSPFPGASGSCSSSSPGVQVMLQPGSTASTEPGAQRGGGLHFRGLPEAFSAAFLAGKRILSSFLHLRSCIFTPR